MEPTACVHGLLVSSERKYAVARQSVTYRRPFSTVPHRNIYCGYIASHRETPTRVKFAICNRERPYDTIDARSKPRPFLPVPAGDVLSVYVTCLLERTPGDKAVLPPTKSKNGRKDSSSQAPFQVPPVGSIPASEIGSFSPCNLREPSGNKHIIAPDSNRPDGAIHVQSTKSVVPITIFSSGERCRRAEHGWYQEGKAFYQNSESLESSMHGKKLSRNSSESSRRIVVSRNCCANEFDGCHSFGLSLAKLEKSIAL